MISQRLGHHSPAFTLTQYGHLTEGLDERAADAVGEGLFGTGEGR